MPRERKYTDAAARQAAYRERQAAARRSVLAGRSDEEVSRAARDLHVALEYEASQGDTVAVLLVGSTPVETLQKISRHLMPL